MPDINQLLKRQQVLGDFGEFAIRSENLDDVLMEACRLVAEALGTNRSKVLEIQPGRDELLVRAGVGWASNVVGAVRLQMSERSSETYSIEVAQPVVVQDIAAETRFDIPMFMKNAGIKSMVNVPIFVPGQRPYGVLQVDDTKARQFGADEIQFLRSYAMILGPVIDRLHLLEERREERRRVQSSEVRHRLLIESWAQAVWEVDASGVVVDDSPSWRVYTGQKSENWLGYGWLDAVHPDDRVFAERQWRDAIAAGRNVDAEFRLCAPDGGWHWTNVRAAPVLNAAGEVEKWVGMNIDIHARKRAEEALAASEQRLSLATAASELGIWEWDLVNDRPIGNLFYYQHFDLEPFAEHRGADVIAKLHPDDIPMMLATHEAAMDPASDGHYTVEYRVLREGMGPRWLYSDGQVFFRGEGADRRPERSLGTSLDITEQKLAQAALQEREEGQAFLLKLSDALRPLVDPADIEDAATRVLGEHLKANRVAYVEVADEEYVVQRDYVNGVPSMVGSYSIQSFGSGKVVDYSKGKTVVVNDIASSLQADPSAATSFAAINIAAGIGVPLMKQGRFVANLVVHASEPRKWTPQEVRIVEETAERTWAAVERARAEAKMRESEERQRALINGVPQLVWQAGAPGHWTWTSPQWSQFTGQSAGESRGWGWLEPLHPDDREAAREAWAHAADNGQLEVDYRIYNQRAGQYRWFQTRAMPLRDEHGAIVEWLGTSTDVDDYRRLQDHQHVLVAELQHRTRNLMGVVRSLANTTARASIDLSDFQNRFRSRLDALARVQGLLSRLNDHDRVTFDEVIETELAAMGSGANRVCLSGPSGVRLRSSMVQTLAMALHELATNAVKYGALAQESGRLVVTWYLIPDDDTHQSRLHIDWRETGVDMTTARSQPSGGGQGRELIEKALPYQLSAKTSYIMEADGVHCTISIPISTTPPTRSDYA